MLKDTVNGVNNKREPIKSISMIAVMPAILLNLARRISKIAVKNHPEIYFVFSKGKGESSGWFE